MWVTPALETKPTVVGFTVRSARRQGPQSAAPSVPRPDGRWDRDENR